MANQGLNAGGRVTLKVNGQFYHPIAEVKVEPTVVEGEGVVNQDGSVQRTVKPKAAKIIFTFRDRRGTDLEALVEGLGFDVTLDEVDMNRQVLLTNAFVVGAARRNTQTGDIEGLEAWSDQIKIIEKA